MFKSRLHYLSISNFLQSVSVLRSIPWIVCLSNNWCHCLQSEADAHQFAFSSCISIFAIVQATRRGRSTNWCQLVLVFTPRICVYYLLPRIEKGHQVMKKLSVQGLTMGEFQFVSDALLARIYTLNRTFWNEGWQNLHFFFIFYVLVVTSVSRKRLS